MEWFAGLHPVTQALLGTLFTWGVTALGAAGVFFFRTIKKNVLNSMLGFASGVMIAASFWSLLAPAIEMSEEMGLIPWLPPALGFLVGGAFLWGVDKTLPHLHPGMKREDAEGIKTSWQRSVLLVLAITLHNIPEGLAVGVAFGAAAAEFPSGTLAGGCGACSGDRNAELSRGIGGVGTSSSGGDVPGERPSGTVSFREPWSPWRGFSVPGRCSPCALCSPMLWPLRRGP